MSFCCLSLENLSCICYFSAIWNDVINCTSLQNQQSANLQVLILIWNGCRFDALSHRSSGNSLNVSENMGVVSKTSTPLSGSIENLGVGNNDLLRNFGQVRKGLASGSQSPLVTNSRTLSNTLPRKSTPSSSILEDQKPEGSSSVLDEWEQKLLGKKSAVPYISPNNQAAKSETLSIQSSTHSSRSNTLERQKVKSTLPTNVLPLPTHEVNLDSDFF